MHARALPPASVSVEAVLLLGTAAVITHRQETITSIIHRLRTEHRAGLLLLCGVAGAVFGHLILEEPNAQPR